MPRNKEGKFQDSFIGEVEKLFPEALIFKTDNNRYQGFADLTILANRFVAVIECKKSEEASYQPNQEYYLDYCADELEVNFVATVFPENEEVVLDELQRAYLSRR